MLRVEKEYGAKRLMDEFPRRNWSLAAVNILTVLTDQLRWKLMTCG